MAELAAAVVDRIHCDQTAQFGLFEEPCAGLFVADQRASSVLEFDAFAAIALVIGAPVAIARDSLGQDDALSWVLVPILGFTVAGCCLTAIVYGLMKPHEWNAKFNPGAEPEAAQGRTGWATVWAIVLSLMVGASVLLASIAISFQGYFQQQVEEGRRISQ